MIASTTINNRLRPHVVNYIMEIIDPVTGEFIGYSGRGELVVTCLTNGIKLLIRYRTGDIVELSYDDSLDLFDAYQLSVVGRVRDSVVLNGKHFTEAELESTLLEGVTDCLGYQIVINEQEGYDSVIVKLEIHNLKNELKNVIDKMITNRFAQKIGASLTIIFVDDLSEHVNLGGWIKWKAARLVDTRVTESIQGVEMTVNTLLERINKS